MAGDLRRLVRDAAGREQISAADVMDELGVDMEDGDVYPKRVEWLADLIDRPTCRLSCTNSEFDTIVSCSRCGKTFLEPPCVLNYCPICGAEVVE